MSENPTNLTTGLTQFLIDQLEYKSLYNQALKMR